MEPTTTTPITTVFDATIGGMAIGLSIAVNAVLLGRITCLSEILGGILTFDQSWFWRVSFQGGIMVAVFLLKKSFPYAFVIESVSQPMATWKLAIAGALVGFGTRLAKGGFSGHAICGVSRRSYRSITFVAIFTCVASLVHWFTTCDGGSVVNTSNAHWLQEAFVLRVEPLQSFFTCIKPVFIGLVGVIFVSVKGVQRSVPSLRFLLPLLVGAYAGYLFAIGVGYSGWMRWLSNLDGIGNASVLLLLLLLTLFPALLLSSSCFYLLQAENYRPILYSHHYIPIELDRVDWQVIVGAICFGWGLGWSRMRTLPETLVVQWMGNPYDVGYRVSWIGMVVGMLLYTVCNWLFIALFRKKKSKLSSRSTTSHKQSKRSAI